MHSICILKDNSRKPKFV